MVSRASPVPAQFRNSIPVMATHRSRGRAALPDGVEAAKNEHHHTGKHRSQGKCLQGRAVVAQPDRGPVQPSGCLQGPTAVKARRALWKPWPHENLQNSRERAEMTVIKSFPPGQNGLKSDVGRYSGLPDPASPVKEYR